MRATSMRRLIGGAAAFMLIGSTLFATGVGAAGGQTRILDIHSPGAEFPALTFTPVTGGGVTVTDVLVTNNGKQTLTKAHLYINLSGAAALPDGVSIVDVFGLVGAGTCTFTASTLDCDFGSLTARGPGKTRQVSIAFQVGSAAPASDIKVTIKVAENVQDVGSNQNFQVAFATPSVGEATCDTLATFVISNHDDLALLPSIDGGCATDPQRSSLELKSNSGSALVELNDSVDANADATCADLGLTTCFGKIVDADVNDGATITPYLTWDITYSASLMHSINPKQVGFLHGTTLIPAGRKGACGATFTGDCIVGYTVNSDGSVTFVIRTKTNSTIRGIH